MSSAATLTINLVANNQLARGMKAARGDVTGFVGSIKSAATAVRGLFALEAVRMGISAIRAFTGTIKESFEQLDTLGKAADRLGLMTEQLGALQYHADLAGVSNEELTSGLEKMLAEVGKGSSAFKQLGLDIDTLKRKNAVDMFGDIADAIDKLPTAADREAAVRSIFGRGGSGFLNAMKGGRAAIGASMAEFRGGGLGVSREQAAAAEAANDAVTRLVASLGALKNVLIVALAPAITATADLLSQASRNFNVWAKAMRGDVGGVMDAFMGRMGRPLAGGQGGGVVPAGVSTPTHHGVPGGGAALMGSREAYSILRQFSEAGGGRGGQFAGMERRLDAINRELRQIAGNTRPLRDAEAAV